MDKGAAQGDSLDKGPDVRLDIDKRTAQPPGRIRGQGVILDENSTGRQVG